jgi:hypothetical protein
MKDGMKKGDKPGEGQKDKTANKAKQVSLDKRGEGGEMQAILEIYKEQKHYVKNTTKRLNKQVRWQWTKRFGTNEAN